VSHANARLTVHGRAELVRRVVVEGRPVAHVVVELNVSRATGYKWLTRWRAEGAGRAAGSAQPRAPAAGQDAGRPRGASTASSAS
jgi:transposase